MAVAVGMCAIMRKEDGRTRLIVGDLIDDQHDGVTVPAEYAARLGKLRAVLTARDCTLIPVDRGGLLAWLAGSTV